MVFAPEERHVDSGAHPGRFVLNAGPKLINETQLIKHVAPPERVTVASFTFYKHVTPSE